ncbi:M20 family metallopeptidase [Methanolobus sp. ZRKC3]|uniref:M20 metallopeptidase family protein n=1 Tax=Methanolobus sp. ZRKC3 TaxID=3125786 RepID=UPI003872D498
MNSLDEWIRAIRRDFHRNPELSFGEHLTQEKIINILNELGIECRKIADTGVIADIRGNAPGHCIAIRADMDALAATELVTERNVDYVSENAGVMHACGHDAHMAIVLGLARLLQEQKDDLSGIVRLIFQPAEEVPPGGAIKIIEEGGLKGVDAILGMHIFGDVDVGLINLCEGPFMASSNRFTIRIFGKGGHHSTPAYCIDPIQISSDFIRSLRTELPMRVDPDNYVLGFGTLNSGGQFNRSPDELVMVGSFRTFDDGDISTIEAVMGEILDSLMLGYSKKCFDGLPSYELDILRGYPVLVNDPVFTRAVSDLLCNHFDDVDDEAKPIFGAEDFSFYLQKVPGTYAVLGTKNPAKGIVEGNHSNSFDVDEDILLKGTRMLFLLTIDFLEDPRRYLK